MRKYSTVGIDLGTTYSTIAFIDEQGKPQVVVNPDNQSPVVPSVVLFDDDEIVVGETALAESTICPDRVAQQVKRSMGDSEFYEMGQSLADRHTPETISAIILKKLLSFAEKTIGPIEEAVITVPAYFNEKRRAATEHAGNIAGIEVAATLNEPTAALIAYGLHQRAKAGIYVVYDLGGGTFDATVMHVGSREMRELATGGNRTLGGCDFDSAIAGHIADLFAAQHDCDPRDDSVAYQLLISACRRAKTQLTDRTRARIQCTHGGYIFNCELHRDEFERLTRRLVARTETTMETCLQEAGVNWSEVEGVVLAGGSTKMPVIGDMIRRLSGKEPICSVDPDLAIALGAAVYAGVLESKRPTSNTEVADDNPYGSLSIPILADPLDQLIPPPPIFPIPSSIVPENDLEDDLVAVDVSLVNSHGIGVFARMDGQPVNVVMIRRNSQLPIAKRRRFRTARDGMRQLRVVISEGDNEQREACEQLGQCVLGPLPAGLSKGSPIDLQIGFSKQGRVQVSATCETSGAHVYAELTATGILSEVEVEEKRRQFAGLRVS